MLLFTAPSKTQRHIERKFKVHTIPRFLEQSQELINILSSYSTSELASLMKMSNSLAESTRQRILDFSQPLENERCRQALFTFQGDAYQAITPAAYSEQQLRHAQEHLVILSGLYGMLRPLDLMWPYRLEMGTRLVTDRGKNLYDYWGESITDEINAICSEKGYRVLVNLASAEYSRVVKKKLLIPEMLTITFKEKKNDVFKTIPIHSKRARSMLIHFVIDQQLDQPGQLEDFTDGGYKFSQEMSTNDNWIFTRDTSSKA